MSRNIDELSKQAREAEQKKDTRRLNGVKSGRRECPKKFVRPNGEEIMRSLLLFFIGVPIPIIIILWLLLGHA